MPNTSGHIAIIEPHQYLCMPWKNGLGETLEIQRYEDHLGLRFRISQASVVQEGLFSEFAGLQRTLVLLSGQGMTMTHKSDVSQHFHVLSNPLDIARFAGSDKTFATLTNGKIEDLNIMVREIDTQAQVEAYIAPCSVSFSSDGALFCGFYANEDSVFEIDGTETVSVKADNTMIITDRVNATLSQGRGVYIRITPNN